MRHPEHVAGLLREGSTWREPFQVRGGRAFDAESWEDACHALAGAGPLPTAAFMWCHVGDHSARHQLGRHLLAFAQRMTLPAEVDPGELVRLALDEQHAPEAQRRDDLRALVLGLTLKQWRQRYRDVHARLLAEVDSLVSDAWRVARGRLEAA